MDYIAYTSPEGEKFASEKAPWRYDFREFEKKNVRPERLMASLFTNPSAIADPDAMMRSLYWIAADMQNVNWICPFMISLSMKNCRRLGRQ